jgi:DNA-binding NtrC family response regulator
VSQPGRGKILIVDDEPENLDLMRRILRAHDTDAFTSPLEALEALKRTRYQLIFCDHAMATMDGITLLERASFVAPLAERILVSAHADFTTLTEAINRAQIRHFLAKPVVPSQLLDLANRLLGQAIATTAPVLMVAGAAALSPGGRAALSELGYEVSFAARPPGAPDTAETAEAAAADEPAARAPDVVLLDLRVSDDESANSRWLGAMRRWPGAAFVLVTGPERAELAVGLAGYDTPHDVMLLPYSREELVLRVRRAHERRRLSQEVQRLRRETGAGAG